MSIFPMDASPPIRVFTSALIFFSSSGFLKEIMPTSRSQARSSRLPRMAAMRTRYRTNFFNRDCLFKKKARTRVRAFFVDQYSYFIRTGLRPGSPRIFAGQWRLPRSAPVLLSNFAVRWLPGYPAMFLPHTRYKNPEHK